MLELPDGVIAVFYALCGEEPAVQSPVAGLADSAWMRERDFCFFNVRATGRGDVFGNWITAAKLLPVVRANAIHLGPFTRYDFGCIYAVQCTRTIAPETVHPGLAAAGTGPEAQLAAFVQAAHLLGKVVGFDLEPHTTQFSIDVLMRPELFRWIRVTPERDGLAGGVSMEAMQMPAAQTAIQAAVRALVTEELAAAGLATLDPGEGEPPAERERKTACYHRLIGRAIAAGCWTVPSHTWAGVGIPDYAGYNREGNYPEFRYLTADGRDQGAEALSIVTPFKFFDNIPVNRLPVTEEGLVPNPAALDYFSGIALRWVTQFRFDFIRYDSADHIFDSVAGGDWGRPATDRPTPEILRSCVYRSRTEGAPHVGNFAERMGNELDDYAAVGFDLILGSDMFDRLDRAHLERCFAIHERLLARAAAGRTPASIVFCTDTHDTGNPFIHGQPLITLEGPDGMLARQFVSRFLGCGGARRPKYEVMGAQDLSNGLYQANVSNVNLEWVGDAAFCRRYHWLEDVYDGFREFLSQARLSHRHVDDHLAWWVLENGGEKLVAVLSLFRGDAAEGLRDCVLPVEAAGGWREHDFRGCRIVPQNGAPLRIAELGYRECRLFHAAGSGTV